MISKAQKFIERFFEQANRIQISALLWIYISDLLFYHNVFPLTHFLSMLYFFVIFPHDAKVEQRLNSSEGLLSEETVSVLAVKNHYFKLPSVKQLRRYPVGLIPQKGIVRCSVHWQVSTNISVIKKEKFLKGSKGSYAHVCINYITSFGCLKMKASAKEQENACVTPCVIKDNGTYPYSRWYTTSKTMSEKQKSGNFLLEIKWLIFF